MSPSVSFVCGQQVTANAMTSLLQRHLHLAFIAIDLQNMF